MSANPRSPESGESTEPVEVVNALRWVAERARDGSTLYLDPADAAVYEAYVACVESLTAELSSARERADRAEETIRMAAMGLRTLSVCDQVSSEKLRHYAKNYADAVESRASSTPTPTPDHA